MNKRLFVLVWAAIVILSLCACGSEDVFADNSQAEEETTLSIAELEEDGYVRISNEFGEDYRALYAKWDENGNSIYRKVVAPVTPEQYKAYYSIEWDDEQRGEKIQAILASLEDVSVKDVSDMVPTREELDSYIGKTIGEMESLGFAELGWQESQDGTYFFHLDGSLIFLNATIEVPGKAMEECSEDEILALTITHVSFSGFSKAILFV